MNTTLLNKTNEQRIDTSLLLACVIGVMGLYVGFANMYIWLILLAFKLTRLNRIEFGFFALLLGGGFFGRIFASDVVVLFSTTLLISLGIIILWREIVRSLREHSSSYFYLFAIYIVFIVFYIAGPQGDYANDKMVKMVVRGLLWLTAFLIYGQTVRFSNTRISVVIILLALFYLSQSAQIYGVFPSSFTDVSFYREHAVRLLYANDHNGVVNYHALGYLALMPFAFTISDRNILKQNKLNTIILIGITFIITVISGARQAVVLYVILSVVRIILTTEKQRLPMRLMICAIIALCFFAILQSIGSSYIDTIFEGETQGERLNRDVVTPFNVFNINPALGVGFGGYPEYANKTYPHNLFLELLCEIGIIGTFIIAIITVLYFMRLRSFFNYNTLCHSLLIIPFFAIFLKAQISGDMNSSITVFSILFSFVVHKGYMNKNTMMIGLDNVCYRVSKRLNQNKYNEE